MTMHASPPPGAITYEQFLRNHIANPWIVCGPPVVDVRPWWQHLPGLNPYAELERQARGAEKPQTPNPDREAEL